MQSLFRNGRASPSCAARTCSTRAFTTIGEGSKAPHKLSSPQSHQVPLTLTRQLSHTAGLGRNLKFAPVKNLPRPNLEAEASPKNKRKQRDSSEAYAVFQRLATDKFSAMTATNSSWIQKREEYQAFGVENQVDFRREVWQFKTQIEKACSLAREEGSTSKTDNPLFWSLRNAFVQGDLPLLARELNYSFQNFLMRQRFAPSIEASQRALADFRFPQEWFPATRALHRTIHLHVGPTNSGKTYNALKALENAKSGIYAGPLRLLAHEVYSRFLAKGKLCALITGEEQRIPENEDNYFRSCTVEMTPLNSQVEVAIIDEIQMIGDVERGWAWTQAFLGVQAKEVHLCGEERVVDLIQSLCDTTGEKCVVHRYKRLSPLETLDKSLRGSLKRLQKGDAVVSFSRVGIHSLKKQIEEATKRRCAIVYGSLPPETRAQQAALFNDPDNDYDFLVASDAIGMGLNLEIKRIIFEQTHKRDSIGTREMTTSEIKQIGGRAGRFKTAAQAIKAATKGASREDDAGILPPPRSETTGYVTTMEENDLPMVIRAFGQEPEPMKTAGIQPPPAVLERFSAYFPPNTPLSYMISRLRDICKLSPLFHLCGLKEMLSIAELIQPFPMSIYDRSVLLNAPTSLREPNAAPVLQALARCISSMQGGALLDIPEIQLELLDQKKDDSVEVKAEYLRRLEGLHKDITLYLWLSYRYSGVFKSQSLAFHVKSLVEAKIDEHLNSLSISEIELRAKNHRMRKQAEAIQRARSKVLGEASGEDSPQVAKPGKGTKSGQKKPVFQGASDVDVATAHVANEKLSGAGDV